MIDFNNPTKRLFGSYKDKEQEEFKNTAKRLGAKVYVAVYDNELIWKLCCHGIWFKYHAYKISFNEFIYFKHQLTPNDPIIFRFRFNTNNHTYINGELYGLPYDPNETRFDIREEASGVFIDCIAKRYLNMNYHVNQINGEEYYTIKQKLETSEPGTLKEIKEKIPITKEIPKELKNAEYIEDRKIIKYRVYSLQRLYFCLENTPINLIEAQDFKNFAYYLYKDGYVSTSPRIKQRTYTEYPEYVVFYE